VGYHGNVALNQGEQVDKPKVQRSAAWLASRHERSVRDYDALVDKALDAIAEIVNDRRDPTRESLTKILSPAVMSSEGVRRRKKGDPAWDWDYLMGRLHKLRPAVHLQWQEVAKRETLDQRDWTALDRPFPEAAGDRREALETYLKRQDELLRAFPRRMLDMEAGLGERATAYCEAAIELVRLLGSASPLTARQSENRDDLDEWKGAARVGVRALDRIAPVVRLADALGVTRRSELYQDLSTSTDPVIRYIAWGDLEFVGTSAPFVESEYVSALATYDIDVGVPAEQLPVARPFLLNPDPVPPDHGGRNKVPYDAAEVLLTRYYLLAAETVFASIRSQISEVDPQQAIDTIFANTGRGRSGPLPITHNLDIIAPVIGMAACAVIDHQPVIDRKPTNEFLRAAIVFIGGADPDHPSLTWLFPTTKAPQWDDGQAEAAATRELARMWVHIDRRHNDLCDLPVARQLAEFLLQQAGTEPEVSGAHHDQHNEYRTVRAGEYQMTASTAADLITLTRSPKTTGHADAIVAARSRQEAAIERRLRLMAGDPVRFGINYLDPVPPQILPAMMAGVAPVGPAGALFQDLFQSLQQLRDSYLWQALALDTAGSWDADVFQAYGLNIAADQWRQILTEDRTYLSVPIDDGLVELQTLVQQLAEAFAQGAPTRHPAPDLHLVIEQVTNLQLQLLQSKDSHPATHPPGNWEDQANAHWMLYLWPALRRGPSTFESKGPLEGRFTVPEPDRTVYYEVNWERAEMVLYRPLHIRAADVDVSRLRELLIGIMSADHALPRCGITVDPEYLPEMRLALTMTLPFTGLTLDQIERTVQDLALHPLAADTTGR